MFDRVSKCPKTKIQSTAHRLVYTLFISKVDNFVYITSFVLWIRFKGSQPIEGGLSFFLQLPEAQMHP